MKQATPNSEPTRAVLRQLRAPQHTHAGVLRLKMAQGDQGAADTIEAMRRVVYDAGRSPHVHQWATSIVAAAPNRDRLAQLAALRQSIIDLIKFKPDTFGLEVVRTPDQLIAEIRTNGVTSCDCDDVATLGVSLLRAMGIPGAFVTIAKGPNRPFTHVYFAANLKGRWLPLDPQERVPLGVHTPGGHRRTRWELLP